MRAKLNGTDTRCIHNDYNLNKCIKNPFPRLPDSQRRGRYLRHVSHPVNIIFLHLISRGYITFLTETLLSILLQEM